MATSDLDRLSDQLDQLRARHAAQPRPTPHDSKLCETTIAQVRHMAEWETHPTWVEGLLEDPEASMSLL